MTSDAADRAAHYDHCGELLRARDRDAWLAALFLPAALRRHAHAIYAFAVEAGDVRGKVSQPMLGELRLRWQVDALDGGAGAHPVIAATLDTIARFSLPRQEFVALVEARVFDLYDDPMESAAMLAAYLGDVYAAPMRWTAAILGAGDVAAAAEAAGFALGLTRILRALPQEAAAGQCFIPADLLARHGASPQHIRAREATPGVRAALKELRDLARSRYKEARKAAQDLRDGQAALLPAATVPLLLDRLEKSADDPFQPRAEPPQWRRQWSLWRAARRGGL